MQPSLCLLLEIYRIRSNTVNVTSLSLLAVDLHLYYIHMHARVVVDHMQTMGTNTKSGNAFSPTLLITVKFTV